MICFFLYEKGANERREHRVCIKVVVCKLRDFATCHDNFDLKPADGVLEPHTFTWLAAVYYIHVTTSLPHQSVAPRVVLVHKQFVLGTAKDLLKLPKNYKLGHVIFGDYERDEEECGLTREQLKMNQKCSRAYFVMPHQEVIAHPEYTRFGIANSLAVVKLVRPIKSSVPIDLDGERMAKKTLKVFPHKDCIRHRRSTLGEGVSHELCTTGCGIRPGAPIISQDVDGIFQLIGLSAGSQPCRIHTMRSRLNDDPPLFIDVFPYVTWIMNVISASVVPRAFPGKLMLTEGGSSIGIRPGFLRQTNTQKFGWRGRMFVSGNYCYMRPKRQRRTAFFYLERFSVKAGPEAKVTVYIRISAGIQCTITCARLLIPNHKSTPIIDGVGSFNISVQLDTNWFPSRFFFTLGLNGKNTSADNLSKWWSQRNPKGMW
ncbi:hypothetical protein RR46_11991 [Papilio xuthus]|uniref:Peptidase S1 domain-containing protein n=1 Tax=Papilio xuthus TaxID=66420 RepID=A0A194PNU9_PAPXU|nr:hypothetical protein RR46_11991 [Papilio xuthus]